MKIKCSQFTDGEEIPQRYSGYGEDLSPPLTWSGIPAGVQSYALICEDVDAYTSKDEPFVHWLIYNMTPNTSYLPEGIPPEEDIDLPVIAMQGINSFGEIGYGGPKPPRGDDFHHYEFTLYALNSVLNLGPGADKASLMRMMKPHIIAKAKLTGSYSEGRAEHYMSRNKKTNHNLEKR